MSARGHEMARDPGLEPASGLRIRHATADDAGRIAALVTALSEAFIVGEFSPGGRAYFLAEHTESKVRQRLEGPFRFHLAEREEELAGVAAIRSSSHLYYLFVARPFQRMGLARRLWERAREEALAAGNAAAFTVNASNHAVPAYEKLGFRRNGPTRERNGVLYNPMQFVVGPLRE